MGCKVQQVSSNTQSNTVTKDTVFIDKVKTDTIKTIVGDTIYLTIIKEVEKLKIETQIQTVINTIYEKCNDRTERIKARLDYKTERDSLETLLKLERENTKQKKHTGQQAVDITKLNNKKDVQTKRIENRNNWWIWFLIGCVVGGLFYRKFLK